MVCCLIITKVFFFIFSLVILVGAVFIFGLQFYALKLYDYNASAETYSISRVSVNLLGGAALLGILGFLGCYGTWKKSKCILYLFAVFLCIVIFAEVALCLLALVEPTDRLEQNLKKYVSHIGGRKLVSTLKNRVVLTTAGVFLNAFLQLLGVFSAVKVGRSLH
ncbi:tetraspanin-1-like [Symsagittifera roscoffensis]|uniref:tetraspanin-1-like n=1 Tax=Symsagittifera roscoffensis TaxID=84072 RepID=UPI00307BED24